MSWIDRLNSEIAADVKSADTFIADQPWGSQWGLMPRSDYDYGRDIGSGLNSNVIMSPVSWIMRTFAEAEPIVEAKRRRAVGRTRWERLEDHRLERRLRRPNPYYGGDALWKGTIISYCLEGDGYWLKVRNEIGEVIQYWYAPHWMMEPKAPYDGSEFISYYEYTPDSSRGPIILSPRDVVHFRFGLDPRNPRKGFSPIRPLLREVFTDEEAANFSAAILRNQGIPGVILAPKDASVRWTEDQAKEAKQKLMTNYTKDRRGEPFVSSIPAEVSTFGFDPNTLMIGNLRDIAEERVCSALGLPPDVVGFGAGLQQTKVGATARENIRRARVACINPMAKSFGDQLGDQTMYDYQAQPDRFRVRFDMSEVSVFQEDEENWEKRIIEKVKAGVMPVDQAQDLLDIEVDETQNVYLRDSRLVPVRANEDPVAAHRDAATNGRGGADADMIDEIMRSRSRMLPAQAGG